MEHIHNGMLLRHEKWNNAICSNMDGPRDYLTKWGKSEREIQISYAITSMRNLKSDANEPFIKQKHTLKHRQNLWLPKGKQARDKLRVWDEQIHTKIYKRNKKDLLDSTQNYTQCLIITYKKKNFKRHTFTSIYL